MTVCVLSDKLALPMRSKKGDRHLFYHPQEMYYYLLLSSIKNTNISLLPSVLKSHNSRLMPAKGEPAGLQTGYSENIFVVFTAVGDKTKNA